MGLVVHLGSLVLRVQQVPRARLVLMVRQVFKDLLVLQVFQGRMVRKVRKVHPAKLGQQVLKESLAELASLESKVKMVQLGHLGLQGRKEHLEMWAVLELQVHRDHQVQMAQKASLVHLVLMDCLVRQEKWVQQDHLVWLVRMVQQVLMVLMARLGVMEKLALLVSLDQQALQVRKVHHRLQDPLVHQDCKALLDHHLTQKRWILPFNPRRATLSRSLTSQRSSLSIKPQWRERSRANSLLSITLTQRS